MYKCIPILFLYNLLFCIATSAQEKKWSGSISVSWLEPLNWQPAGIPNEGDDLVFDNSIHPSTYTVILPSEAVAVHTLVIAPGPGQEIIVQIPPANLKSPALSISGGDACFVLRQHALFINSSGLASGQSVQINGVMKIGNGARYIHNTRSIHASDIVAKLRVEAGDEDGVFEFDVPGGAYPVSLSNRNFGSLVFSSKASGGTQTYNASGSNLVQVSGDFEMTDGVQLNLDLVNDFIISGDFVQQGGVLNLASQANKNRFIIKGRVDQAEKGTITETSTGEPVIELAGSSLQEVAFKGNLLNDVGLSINNAHGVLLLNTLRLPFTLRFVMGKIVSNRSARLVISERGTVQGASADSFVEGAIEKIGEGAFTFPIGRQRNYAPLSISAGGERADSFIAEYQLADPGKIYGNSFNRFDMVRISMLEYWKLERVQGTSPRKITVTVGAYSGATAVDKLVVAGWNPVSSSWESKGNTGFTGITSGTVTSDAINQFIAFTVGSTVAPQNPLPLSSVSASGPAGLSSSGQLLEIESISASTVCLRLTATGSSDIQLLLFDMQGKLLTGTTKRLQSGINHQCLDILSLTAGVYILRVQGTNREKQTVVFVKR